jgi:hypothetical protein
MPPAITRSASQGGTWLGIRGRRRSRRRNGLPASLPFAGERVDHRLFI